MSDPATVCVRPALPGDAYALWLWANDEHTRQASFGRASIPWKEHRCWLESVLSGEDTVLLVGEIEGDQPVGSIRFNSADGWNDARVSYVLAPESRGLRLSGSLIASGVDYLHSRHPSASLWADVVADNAPSLRVFRRAGWREEIASFGSRFRLLASEIER